MQPVRIRGVKDITVQLRLTVIASRGAVNLVRKYHYQLPHKTKSTISHLSKVSFLRIGLTITCLCSLVDSIQEKGCFLQNDHCLSCCT